MRYRLTAFPSLAVPVLLYAIFAVTGGEGFRESLGQAALRLHMPAGATWALTWGEIFVTLGLIALFVDLLKATGTSAATIVNHMLSAAVFIVSLILFLLMTNFVTSPFFLLTFMALLDVIAGFTITIIAARRDVAYEH